MADTATEKAKECRHTNEGALLSMTPLGAERVGEEVRGEGEEAQCLKEGEEGRLLLE
jgi:hypothetical protein